jgi:hypothetical protein
MCKIIINLNISSNVLLITIFLIRVLVLVSKNCLVNGSREFFDGEIAIARAVEIIEDLFDLLFCDHDILDLGKEVRKLLEVQLSIAVFVSQLHPVEGNLLHFVDGQGLTRGLRVQQLKDLVLLFLL